PSSNILQAVPLEPAVERAAAEAERLGGLADVAVEARHGFLDQEALDVFEAHVFEASAAFLGRGAEAEIRRLDERTGGHQDGALDGMIQFAHVAWPGVLEQHLHGAGLEAGQPLAIALRMLPQEMLGEQRQVLAAIAKRGQPDLDRVQAEQQILPASARPRFLRRGWGLCG